MFDAFKYAGRLTGPDSPQPPRPAPAKPAKPTSEKRKIPGADRSRDAKAAITAGDSRQTLQAPLPPSRYRDRFKGVSRPTAVQCHPEKEQETRLREYPSLAPMGETESTSSLPCRMRAWRLSVLTCHRPPPPPRHACSPALNRRCIADML